MKVGYLTVVSCLNVSISRGEDLITVDPSNRVSTLSEETKP